MQQSFQHSTLHLFNSCYHCFRLTGKATSEELEHNSGVLLQRDQRRVLARRQGTLQFSVLSHCLYDGFEQYKPEFLKQCLVIMSQEEKFHKAREEYIHIINANKAKRHNVTACSLPILANILDLFIFQINMCCIYIYIYI